jgi:hypothetical protein
MGRHFYSIFFIISDGFKNRILFKSKRDLGRASAFTPNNDCAPENGEASGQEKGPEK